LALIAVLAVLATTTALAVSHSGRGAGLGSHQPLAEAHLAPSARSSTANAPAARPAAAGEAQAPAPSPRLTPLTPAKSIAPPAEPANGTTATTSTASMLYTVQPGESFWSIAAATIDARLGHPANDGEIGSYWVQLVDANGPNLVVPADADLLLPGQVVVLPAVPTAAAAGTTAGAG
jgi:nucleoid-associated protein YgaU